MADKIMMGAEKPFIHLGDFDGPLDLLLQLFRQDHVDSYDIPIELWTRRDV